ncbi:3458_t:CDS:2 [Gigaspora margarita]|uniref:3458_t:CDS:1 n=1 Tax=Gigaspora margarita TaxID=4874 RepID=A0ABN7URE6_GIGMA|nr:3458_t:CDS:2 [Gigaspora margarita]
MEYLEFANEISPHRIIGVVVNSDGTSKSFDLEVSDINNVLLMTLDEMREYLCEKGSLFIGRQNTSFRNVFENKIPLARESECKLKDILIPTNEGVQDGLYSFYLEKNLKMPGFPEIVNTFNLDRGCIKNEDGIIEPANMSAFRVKKPHMMDVIIDQKLEQHNADPGRKLIILKKGTIRLLQEDLEPTKEFIEAIENAINHFKDNHEQREALNRVGEEYGFFWSKEVKLGGKLYVNDGQTNDLNQLENLRHFENWQIIEQNELLPLYNLLPLKLITSIKKIIGKKLLHYDILSARMPKNCNSITIRIQKPRVISTFDKVKIFTSVIVKNEARAYRNVFGIRVDYLNNENPYIVIHRIGPARKHFEFSIPWMIIGYEENLPIEPFKDDPIDYIWTKNNAENDATNICCYQYDLQTERIRNTLKFKVNYAIIPDTPIFKVTCPVEHNWKYRPSRLQYRLRNSRTFTGNKWQLDTRQKAIFASIHYSDVQGHPLLLNIHKKYPIGKFLNHVPENHNASVGYVEVEV